MKLRVFEAIEDTFAATFAMFAMNDGLLCGSSRDSRPRSSLESFLDGFRDRLAFCAVLEFRCVWGAERDAFFCARCLEKRTPDLTLSSDGVGGSPLSCDCKLC